MDPQAKKILLVVGGVVLALCCLFCVAVGAIYYQFTACVSDLGETEESIVATIDCPSSQVEVVDRRIVVNWLEGVSNHEAVLRVSGSGIRETIDLPVVSQRFRDWLPEGRRPPHRVDGDASVGGFEVYLDPAVVTESMALEVETCLVGAQREALLRALVATPAHQYHPEPDRRNGITYWRAAPGVLEPLFTDPLGRTLQVQGDGAVWYQNANLGTLVGQVRRADDGSLRLEVELDPEHERMSQQGQAEVGDFVNADGEGLEAFFGVPVIPEFDELR